MTDAYQIETILLEDAVEISDAGARRMFLDQTCRDNPQLRARIEKLLAVRAEAEEFFVLPDAEPAAWVPDGGREERIGANIGRYRLLERMGEGGCGVVYLAEQLQPVRRKVALKIIRLGMDTERVIARFEMERQALALMNHPNIAQVLDAGATAGGRPYFVMEVVEGEIVTAFCDQNRLGLQERLELFIRICQAIQHAHQKGVIHRDIKPSNIMVKIHDGQPVPKVIDFGIAKATGDREPGDTQFTAFDQFLGTPAYMSPEQAVGGGLDVDTRSDIYGLGVLLYELLVGQPPFDPQQLKKLGADEVRRILREEDAPVPSVAVATMGEERRKEVAARRLVDPGKLGLRLKGDLDWIVMKALEKDRQRRYGTANGLAMDLQRHLANEPVTAGPPGRRYRLGKLVRRNRGAFVAGGMVFTALLIGLGIAYGSLLRERQAKDEQSRLLHLAEISRSTEERLREAATIRENISNAAILLSEGNPEEADALLHRTRVEGIEPSIEAANVLRSLGEWNAMRARWTEASESFRLLVEMNRSLSSETVFNSRDLLVPAPVMILQGDIRGYERFRQEMRDRFVTTTNIQAAEQVLKVTLLRPAAPAFLESLKPVQQLTEQSHWGNPQPGSVSSFGAWSAWSISLIEYRKGNFGQALEWIRIALTTKSPNDSRSLGIYCVSAMSNFQLGRTEAGRQELEKARELIDRAFTPEMAPAYEPCGKDQGYWWDWVIGRILFQEAESLILGQG